MANGFTAKELRFIEEYVKCLDKAKSARRAGYSIKSARNIGWQNYTKLHIREEIDRRIKEQIMPKEEILQLWARQARLDPEDLFDMVGNVPVFNADKARETGAMMLIESFKVTDKEFTIKLPNKQKAIELLAKQHGLLAETLKVETWQDRAIEDIRKGNIGFDELAEEFDIELATQLFRTAGVRISLSEDS